MIVAVLVVKAGQRVLHIDIFQTAHQHPGTFGLADALQHLIDVHLPLYEPELVVDPVILVGQCDIAEFFVLEIQRHVNIGTVGAGIQIVRQQVLFQKTAFRQPFSVFIGKF